MNVIYHLAEPEQWAAAQAARVYPWSTRARTIADQGFLHASHAEQVEIVASNFYTDVLDDLLVLTIDADRLGHFGLELREEPGDPTDPASPLFPHVYGGDLPTELVSEVTPYRRFAVVPRPVEGA